MEIKAQDLRDSILKLQGQIEMLSALYKQALEEEKKTHESVPQDK